MAILKLRNYPKGLVCVLAIVICALGTASRATAEIITVQIINGRSGKSIRNAKVYLNFDQSSAEQEIGLKTNSRGEIYFDATKETSFHVTPIGFISCGAQPIGSQAAEYQVHDVIASGIVSQNTCGKAIQKSVKGHLVYYVLPASWWQMFKN